jgi:hypothetical protein
MNIPGLEDERRHRTPQLPPARGPLSAAALDVLTGRSDNWPDPSESDAYGEDLQLALYLCYELHYRGFAGVPDDAEWNAAVLRLRRELETVFLAALRRDVRGGDDLDSEIDALLTEPVDGDGPSFHLARDGSLDQLREYVTARSIYHLKEADPQAWVIPRLEGSVKAAVVSVEHDEYGAGRGDRMHARLFAQMMQELGLDSAYGAYLPVAPGEVLAEVNLMSLCGLHRALRGAAIGQFAVVELTSSPGSARLVRAARRLGAGPATEHFYAEHVEADAVHEQVLRREVLKPLVAAEPHLAADIVFGIQAAAVLDAALGARLLSAWRSGGSALEARDREGVTSTA